MRDGSGSLDDALQSGITWGFGRYPQNRDLLAWLRRHNEELSESDAVAFYGFDVPGSPSNRSFDPNPRFALDTSLELVTRLDGTIGTELSERLTPFLPSYDKTPGEEYDRMAQPDRDRITATIADLIDLLARNEASFTGATSPDEYWWAYRTAVGARQLDDYMRAWTSVPSEDEAWRRSADSRDRAQAENLEEILERAGPDARMVVFAQGSQISGSPITDPLDVTTIPMGTYLRDRYGTGLVTIGNIIGGGERGCPGPRPLSGSEFEAPRAVYHLLGALAHPVFLLDLRTATGDAAIWIDQERWVTQPLRLNLRRGFDMVYYIDAVTPACSG